MDLFTFQAIASAQIAERFWQYYQDPLTVTRTKLVPFYQNLSAITGSGKTLILADAVVQIRNRLSLEPIVLWLSKGRVVVWQTYANLSTGKYAGLLGDYDIKPLLDCCPDDVENSNRGLLLVATVGKFNQKDKAQGDRKIFRVELDVSNQSLWDLLKSRKDSKGLSRPFIVVYDEGHNLSNQQTELLLELAPDALIVASATMRIPDALAPTIERLKQDKHWKDSDFVTAVRSSEVVASGLIKKSIMLGGYITPMEIAVEEMLREMAEATSDASALGVGFIPKAIYVSNTNAVDGVSIRDDMVRPFSYRMARPILIWLYLVEKAGIDPAQIAVYCDLKFDSKFPPPPSFNLFSGGDADYDQFIVGGFRHIIFNLSLQEGWDDPECCFAYIDKDMGSPDQVTQVIGRVLRQPGAQHYPPSNLNTAHFYIRTDEKRVFEEILMDVGKKLATDCPEISITVRKGVKGGDKPYKEPRKNKEVPTVSVYSQAAQEPIRKIVERIHNYTQDKINTVGKGSRIQILQTIGSGKKVQEEWIDLEHSNRVTARWILRREIQRLFSNHGERQRNPINLCDIEHPKFDALVEYYSPAADSIRDAAKNIINAYIQNSEIVQNALDHPYRVEKIAVDENTLVRFHNSIHEGYSDLNGFELEFAKAIDKTKRVWCRNPAQSGFGIPLLDYGDTNTFYPDFLVWTEKYIVAIDTKGDHLITQDAARKLFYINKIEDGPELIVRLVTQGEWNITQTGELVTVKGNSGYTVWRQKQGKLSTKHCKEAVEAVESCLEFFN
ncbi:DEAD/DEAH box helicase family protein [Kamptonema sp. UHCC 0994]|uniref:DEAD/DEAH box helicase family protein n=1 Tax=Kamptonema sp. UHCC 0994 TaxID=3031329 RepID=UPI0023B95FCA|nr:DEAD/DEAH box helicase family protein [Kamptonema sp. UHCC 0994]MDF0554446.1 DEAD/DEAH box helicase family protein [Kamptonema sp. UHCC 0994]